MRWSLACGVLLSLLARPLAAGRLGVVARPAAAGSDRAATSVLHALTQQLQGDKRHELALPEVTLGGSQREAAERAFVVAGELMDRAAAAYEELELDAAVELLQTAIAKYEQHAAYLPATGDVVRGCIRLAAMRMLRDEASDARDVLRRAFALEPNAEPDARMYNPAMRTTFHEVRAALTQQPKGSLALASTPSYAEVYLDGRFVGVSPVSVSEVVAGRHFVRLVKDGYVATGQMVDVRGGQQTNATLRLSPTKRFDDFDTLADQAVVHGNLDAIEQLGVLLNLDLLVMAKVSLDGERVELRSTLYDLNARKQLGQHVQSFGYSLEPSGYDDVIRDHLQRLLQGLAAPAARAPDGPSHAATQPAGGCEGADCRRSKTIAVALSLTGGVIAMGVGGVLWGLAKGDNDAYRATAQVSAESGELLSAGQTKALVGDILFGVGTVAIAAGAILILTWEPASSPSTDVAAGNDPFVLIPWVGPAGAGMSVRAVF